ncbi:hypothetical protein M2272_001586 [Mycobacterium frederiksbergense]|uniref:Uncharacterized protein n=1 Tax=Mycolicibacterium frederiksbergense TaxID=117567 RepID=A0ABT6KY96_9MYCO|nr:hypothetical protein [Mycolicibacterium frederiksbergense]MDH6194957.1 hypothetical protein [Mycolicibacterium frederiksbergense]
MNRPLASSAVIMIMTAGFAASACAHASPEPAPPGPAETAPPAAGSACGQALDGALTPAPAAAQHNDNAKQLLQCADGRWQQFLDPYPVSDRWLTTGPVLVLHGQGLRNPEVKAGAWTALPQSDHARCSAQRINVVAAGQTSAPENFSGDPGEPVTLDVGDHTFTVQLSGYCLWQRG